VLVYAMMAASSRKPKQTKRTTWLCDSLEQSLEVCATPADGEVRPVAVLWPDSDRQWAELVAKPMSIRAPIFVLGPYDPKTRTGPAVWLRCVVDKVLADVNLAESDTQSSTCQACLENHCVEARIVA